MPTESRLGFSPVLIDIKIDRKHVVSRWWTKVPHDGGARPCYDYLIEALESRANDSLPIPAESDIEFNCLRTDGATESVTCFLRDPIGFVLDTIGNRFYFNITLPVAARAAPVNALSILMQSQQPSIHRFPNERDRVTGKDELYNDIIAWLRAEGAGWNADTVDTVGIAFVSTLTTALFPLGNNVWRAINDPHNRGGPAPDPVFAGFFGRKILGHKTSRPNLQRTVEHLQELFIGAGSWLKKGRWPFVSLKIKALSTLIFKYHERTSDQAVRQSKMNTVAEPARTEEAGSSVHQIEALKDHTVMSKSLKNLCHAVMNMDVYEPLDVQSLMKGLTKYKR